MKPTGHHRYSNGPGRPLGYWKSGAVSLGSPKRLALKNHGWSWLRKMLKSSWLLNEMAINCCICGLDTTPFKSNSKASPLLSSFYLASTQHKNMWTCAFFLRWDDCTGWPDTHILLWRSIPDIMCKNCMVGFSARQRAQGDGPGPGQWTDPQCCRVSRKKGDRWRRGRGDNDGGDREGWCWWWLGCEWKKDEKGSYIRCMVAKSCTS